MSDQVLDILKLVLLALLYLFFARVLWAVWSEVRNPAAARNATDAPPAPQAAPAAAAPPAAPAPGKREVKPMKGRRDVPARLEVIEPKDRRGTVFAIGAAVTIGRESDNTVRIEDDSYVSGHHARISVVEGAVVVDDLGSRNGTYLNGTPLTHQRKVHIGDRIQVGYTILEAQ